MQQLEAKIETGRHNLKIKMDKELNILQKEIHLHVSDIRRIQGLMSRLAIKKGETNDELRRHKEKARKTMKQLKTTKKIGEGSGNLGASLSPSKATKQGGGGGFITTAGSGGGANFVEDSPINLLLFSNMKKTAIGNMMTSTSGGGLPGGGTIGSNSTANNTYMNVILPLKNIIKTC